MFVIIPTSTLFSTALILVIIHWIRPKNRFSWWIATGGAIIAWVSILAWHFRLPITMTLPRWEPSFLYKEALSFSVDTLAWTFAFSIATLILAVILTATVRENFPAPIPWAASLLLSGLGILGVLAENPLSLLMIWAAIDLTELITQLRSVDGSQLSEKVVTAFASRIAGIGMLLWASVVSINAGTPMKFQNVPPQVGLYLVLAAGLRLGVFPLHLPYASESAIRRGFGTILRLVSAATSLILLVRIPSVSNTSVFVPILISFTAVAALFGGWMWFLATDELTARPYWLIGLASLAIASSLRGNSVGAAAWGCALLLSGGALFLSSGYKTWLRRILWVGIWGITALPLSITATGWESSITSFWLAWPFVILAQALIIAGYIRHAARPLYKVAFESLDPASQMMYIFGINLLLAVIALLGLWGWDGSLQTGAWLTASVAVILGGVLARLAPRIQSMSLVSAGVVKPFTSTWMDFLFRGLWKAYRAIGRISGVVSTMLEGDGGIMWMLLFLVLFISLITKRTLGL